MDTDEDSDNNTTNNNNDNNTKKKKKSTGGSTWLSLSQYENYTMECFHVKKTLSDYEDQNEIGNDDDDDDDDKTVIKDFSIMFTSFHEEDQLTLLLKQLFQQRKRSRTPPPTTTTTTTTISPGNMQQRQEQEQREGDYLELPRNWDRIVFRKCFGRLDILLDAIFFPNGKFYVNHGTNHNHNNVATTNTATNEAKIEKLEIWFEDDDENYVMDDEEYDHFLASLNQGLSVSAQERRRQSMSTTFRTVRVLCLHSIHVTRHRATLLCHGLQDNCTVEELDLSYSKLIPSVDGDEIMSHVQPSSMTKKEDAIVPASQSTSITLPAHIILANSIRFWPLLHTLVLDSCSLTDQQVSEMIYTLADEDHPSSSLRELCLDSNHCSYMTMNAIAHWIGTCTGNSLEDLSLADQEHGDHLYDTGGNDEEHTPMSDNLYPTLSLSLHPNFCHALSLPSAFCKLKYLQLSRSFFSFQDFVCLTQALRQNSSLTQLDLEGCDMSVLPPTTTTTTTTTTTATTTSSPKEQASTMTLLCDALCCNSTLSFLNLTDCDLRDESLKILSSRLDKMSSSFRKLILEGNEEPYVDSTSNCFSNSCIHEYLLPVLQRTVHLEEIRLNIYDDYCNNKSKNNNNNDMINDDEKISGRKLAILLQYYCDLNRVGRRFFMTSHENNPTKNDGMRDDTGDSSNNNEKRNGRFVSLWSLIFHRAWRQMLSDATMCSVGTRMKIEYCGPDDDSDDDDSNRNVSHSEYNIHTRIASSIYFLLVHGAVNDICSR